MLRCFDFSEGRLIRRWVRCDLVTSSSIARGLSEAGTLARRYGRCARDQRAGRWREGQACVTLRGPCCPFGGAAPVPLPQPRRQSGLAWGWLFAFGLGLFFPSSFSSLGLSFTDGQGRLQGCRVLPHRGAGGRSRCDTRNIVPAGGGPGAVPTPDWAAAANIYPSETWGIAIHHSIAAHQLQVIM